MENSEQQPREPILRVENVSKAFHEVQAVRDASFELYKGEILGIIGPNGSGKTTLFNLISGVLEPDSGNIYAKRIKSPPPIRYAYYLARRLLLQSHVGIVGEEENIARKKPDIILNEFGISRTFQIVRPFKLLTAQENTTVPHIPTKMTARPATLKSAALRSLLEVDLGEKKNYPALILPHGDLKRLDFARANAPSPKVLLLDEPFSGLSMEDAFRVTQLIKNTNKNNQTSLIIVEHKLKLLTNLVTRIVVLDQGRVIAEGTPAEIAKNKRVIESYLGMEATLIA